jgi:hypothetical protein
MLVSSAEIPEEAGVRLHFSDGAVLLAIYWRTISKHWATLTSFDHGQKYGLTSPIDAPAIDNVSNRRPKATLNDRRRFPKRHAFQPVP